MAANTAAAALGARTARSCDGCMRRRARWHCPADDAFLCAACDAAVHSANAVARRHRRVRLGADAAAACACVADDAPSWLKRRARTPRGKAAAKNAAAVAPPAVLVPDVDKGESSGGGGLEEEEEEELQTLLYRVPVFDPSTSLAVLCDFEPPALAPTTSTASPDAASGYGFAGFDDQDFADMEVLLHDGTAVDNLDFLDTELNYPLLPTLQEPAAPAAPASDVSNGNKITSGGGKTSKMTKKRKMELMLTLDYEAVMATWSLDGRSPWTGGERPREPWADSMFARREIGGAGAAAAALLPMMAGADQGREARVSRYREKRRTRLFAKKIRYEVRKLNAEKRPRMKGRFVKRAPSPCAAAARFKF